ncbi:hypothetical protein HWV62_10863 [Athelia sp. TMB]|nr:hypothetical protein HWV62_10863 [Athelia sp. TMB]
MSFLFSHLRQSSEAVISTKDGILDPSPNIGAPLDLDSFLDMDESNREYCSRMQGHLAIAGVGISVVFSIACMIVGVLICRHTGRIDDVVLPPGWSHGTFPTLTEPYTGLIAIFPNALLPSELVALLLNLAVTFCTECVGFVHSVTLKSTLALEGQLAFNTNPRLFSRMHLKHWYHANGPIFNVAMMLLLTLSYSSSSLCFVQILSYSSDSGARSKWGSTCVFGIPLIVLGITILLQSFIATYSILTVKILTWSSSPFDTAFALLRNGLLLRKPGRSMHTAVDGDVVIAPARERQPSAWQCHPVVKRVVVFLWVLGLLFAVWGSLVYIAWNFAAIAPGGAFVSAGSWALIPNLDTDSYEYLWLVDPLHGTDAWPIIFATLAAAQGLLTFGLHCAELIANVMRDELQWRQATTSSGMPMSRNPIVGVLGSWPNMLLLLAKPFLHWLFGLAMTVAGTSNPLDVSLLTISVINRPYQIWYLSGATFIFAGGMTALALRHPPGLQPAAFGHIQTLANVVDVWAPTIWWGYKVTNESAGHAGTSDWSDVPTMSLGPSMA